MSKELDDAELAALLKRVAERDEAAFRRLYEAMARRIYAFVLHRMGDAQAAEEIAADTLFDVWRRPAAWRGEARVSTWLIGIARHKMIDRFRSRTTEHDDIEDHLDLPDADAPEGFASLAGRQREAGVADCLDTLGEPHRECLFLAYYEDMPVADISAVQQVPEGTVKTRLFHARAKIKQCLQRLMAAEAGHG